MNFKILTLAEYKEMYAVPITSDETKQDNDITKNIADATNQIDNLCGGSVFREYEKLDPVKDKIRIYKLQRAIGDLTLLLEQTGKMHFQGGAVGGGGAPFSLSTTNENANIEQKRQDIIKSLIEAGFYTNLIINKSSNAGVKRTPDALNKLVEKLSTFFLRTDGTNDYDATGLTFPKGTSLIGVGDVEGTEIKDNNTQQLRKPQIKNYDIAGYQKELTAGTNIEISADNVISAKGGGGTSNITNKDNNLVITKTTDAVNIDLNKFLDLRVINFSEYNFENFPLANDVITFNEDGLVFSQSYLGRTPKAKVRFEGDTIYMFGTPEETNPTDARHLTTKHYVDTGDANLQTQITTNASNINTNTELVTEANLEIASHTRLIQANETNISAQLGLINKNIEDIVKIKNITTLVFEGLYDPSKTYKKGDIVITTEKTMWLSLENNNHSPLVDGTKWFQVDLMDLSNYFTKDQIEVMLQNYYTKTELNALLLTLETRLAGIESNVSNKQDKLSATQIADINDVPNKMNTLTAERTFATKRELSSKQGTLTAGDNITIDSNNRISATSSGGVSKTYVDTEVAKKQDKLYNTKKVNVGGKDTNVSEFVVGSEASWNAYFFANWNWGGGYSSGFKFRNGTSRNFLQVEVNQSNGAASISNPSGGGVKIYDCPDIDMWEEVSYSISGGNIQVNTNLENYKKFKFLGALYMSNSESMSVSGEFTMERVNGRIPRISVPVNVYGRGSTYFSNWNSSGTPSATFFRCESTSISSNGKGTFKILGVRK